MGIIKIRTPNGVEQVRIAGDSPTDEEQQAIVNTFFADQASTPDQAPVSVEPTLPCS